MSKYTEIKAGQAECWKCFFAFSNEQFAEGKKKAEIADGEKIYNGGYGLYGTKEGIQKFMGFYDEQSKQIAAECDPQEVYDYEFGNHECSYTCDDEECIKIVCSYFGLERTLQVKRRFGYFDIAKWEGE
jgi:hypothetical protein